MDSDQFDYNAPDAPATAVADVVADITSRGKLPPLSDAEKEQRRIANELYRRQCQRREEERAYEYRERQAEAEAVARAERAAEIAERNRKARLELQERNRERQRDSQITDLHFRARQAELWQQNVDRAAYNAVQQRYRNSLVGELDAMINAQNAQPPSEPVEVIERDPLGSPNFFDDDYNPHFYRDKFWASPGSDSLLPALIISRRQRG